MPLTYILTIEGIGVFQLVMSVFSFALVLTSGGITVTLSKLVSTFRAKREFGKIRWSVYLALCYCVFVSFIFGLMFLFLGGQISNLQASPQTNFSYKLFFPLLLFSSLVALFRGVFQGYENMIPTALSQIIEQLSKFVFGLIFALILSKKSIELGVAGAFIGIILSEILAFLYIMIAKNNLKYKKIRIEKYEKKEFYSYLIPATVGLVITAFVHFFDAIVVVGRLIKSGMSESMATSLFGLQTGVVGAILNFPIIISFALSTSILPKLSYANSSSKIANNGSLKDGFKILWISILPITFGLVAIASPMFKLIYPFFDANTLNYAVRLMALGGVYTITLAIMQYFTTILQSKGKFGYVCFSLGVGGFLKILATFFLSVVPNINIFSLPIGNIVFSSIVIFFCLIKLKREVFIGVNEFFVPLISSFVMLVVVFFFIISTNLSVIVTLILSIIIGVGTFACLCFPLFKDYIFKFLGKNQSRRKSESKKANRDSVKEN